MKWRGSQHCCKMIVIPAVGFFFNELLSKRVSVDKWTFPHSCSTFQHHFFCFLQRCSRKVEMNLKIRLKFKNIRLLISKIQSPLCPRDEQRLQDYYTQVTAVRYTTWLCCTDTHCTSWQRLQQSRLIFIDPGYRSCTLCYSLLFIL